MLINIYRSFIPVIILLVLSCDETSEPKVIEGCTVNSACNYNQDATENDDSCITPQGCNDWCAGDEGEPYKLDCNYYCGATGDGTSLLDTGVFECLNPSYQTVETCTNAGQTTWGQFGNDACGNCGGDCIANENELIICSSSDDNNYNQIIVDECGICGGTGIPNEQCDCDGTGPAVNYDCDGNCEVGVDCEGVCGGGTLEDECGVCGGNQILVDSCDGTNNDAWCTCDQQCDICGICGGDDLPNILDLGFCDCDGIPNGSAYVDDCGVS